MVDEFLSSDSVRVYPASNRGDVYDRYSKLNVEHNLINIINRLTGVDSFIVDGLDVAEGTITAGTCNIHGFLFSIDAHTLPDVEANKYLCLKIRVDKSASLQLEQLSNVADGQSAASDNGSGSFTGICWCTYTQAEINNIVAPTYVLPIAKAIQGAWQSIMLDDGEGTSRAFNQLFTLNQILVESSQAGNTYSDKMQTLKTFLERNYILDDGEIL